MSWPPREVDSMRSLLSAGEWNVNLSAWPGRTVATRMERKMCHHSLRQCHPCHCKPYAFLLGTIGSGTSAAVIFSEVDDAWALPPILNTSHMMGAKFEEVATAVVLMWLAMWLHLLQWEEWQYTIDFVVDGNGRGMVGCLMTHHGFDNYLSWYEKNMMDLMCADVTVIRLQCHEQGQWSRLGWLS